MALKLNVKTLSFLMTPKGSKTNEETQISTYAGAVERKYRVSLGTSVLILSDKYSWSLPAATQPCIWSVNGVGCTHTTKKADRKRQLQLSDKIMTPYLIFMSSD
jgi:hypothetical protein